MPIVTTEGLQNDATSAEVDLSSVQWAAAAGTVDAITATYDTEIAGYDKATDLAILQIKQKEIPFTLTPAMADPESVVRGERVWIVGNPMMLEATVVEGVVSSLHRQLEVGGDEKRDYIQYSGGTFGGRMSPSFSCSRRTDRGGVHVGSLTCETTFVEPSGVAQPTLPMPIGCVTTSTGASFGAPFSGFGK